MKTSIDLPDELYRRVKARSALEGRAVREVATELLTQWVESMPSTSDARGVASITAGRSADWFRQWEALGARVENASRSRDAAAKRRGNPAKGARKRPAGLVEQLKRDRR